MADWWDSAEWRKIGSGESDEVIRRDFLAALAALGGLGWARGVVGAHAIAEHLLAAPAHLLAQEMESLTLGLAARWDDGHPAKLLRETEGLYAVLQEMHESTGRPRDVARLAARNASLAGLMARVTGNNHAAWSRLLEADTWAIEAQDHHLRALIAVWMSDLDSAVQAGRPGPSSEFVRKELDRAEVLAGTSAPPAVLALLLLRQAEEHAAAADIGRAYHYLDRADTAWSNSHDRQTNLYGIGWSGGTIHNAFRASVYVLCGAPSEALPILGPVIAGARSNSNRVGAMTDYGSAVARLGEVDHAAQVLAEALELARVGGLQERVGRIVGVRERDLQGRDQEPAVRRLDELLAVG